MDQKIIEKKTNRSLDRLIKLVLDKEFASLKRKESGFKTESDLVNHEGVYKIVISGRLQGAKNSMANKYIVINQQVKKGLKLQSINSEVRYAYKEVWTKWGILGLKIYIVV